MAKKLTKIIDFSKNRYLLLLSSPMYNVTNSFILPMTSPFSAEISSGVHG